MARFKACTMVSRGDTEASLALALAWDRALRRYPAIQKVFLNLNFLKITQFAKVSRPFLSSENISRTRNISGVSL